MSTVITIEDIRAYSEVDYIIHHMNQKYIDMVPQKLLKFFSEMKDPTYEVKVNPYIPLEKQNLSHYSLELLALMHLKYWCEDESRKKELYDIMLSNESSLLEKMYEKKNVDAIFESFEETRESNSEEYSRPRELNVVGTGIVEEDDSDVTFEDEDISSEETESNNLPSDSTDNKKGFFVRLKEKIVNFFSKNK